MKKLSIFILIILISNFLGAQQLINNNWYYGYGAGLNFNTSPPTSIVGMYSVSNEASNAVSDRNNGNLLFYTNSDTVYDATHSPMLNGMNLIGGGHSSYQGVISVPDPGDSNRYFMFSVGDAQYGGTPPTPANWLPPYGGFAYHIIDMTLNGGNGDVAVRDQLIKQIYDTSAGKWFEQRVTAAPHCNGSDYWVIVRREDSLSSNSSLYAYLLTAGGVQAPVISNGGMSSKGFGGMKFSPDASKFAFIGSKVAPFTGTFDPIKLEVFDFDNSSGVFTSYANYDIGTMINTGLSFSPNSQFLYFSGGGFTAINGTYQIDLNNPNPATNMVQISVSTPNALQLARDGKIYAPAGLNSVDVNAILNPNTLGVGANFTNNYVTLSSGQAWTGMCNTIDAFLTSFCTPITCVGNLVPNPSFEDTIYCPTVNGQMDAVQNWDKPFTGSAGTGTSDYYNSCGNYSIPSNSGNAYAGFITYINFLPNAREYVQVQLSTPLQAGQCYEASMYLALESGSGYVHDSVGMLFTNTAPLSPGGAMITATPQVVNTTANLVSDSNWVQITGTFEAQGGEDFLTIGVFTSDANLTITPSGAAGIGSKYMVDDVCLRAIQEDSVYTSLLPDDTICDLTNHTLTAPNGYAKYTWLDGAGNILAINQQSYNYTQSGNKTFVLAAFIDTVCPNVLYLDTINIYGVTCGLSVNSDTVICQGDSILLTSFGSVSGYNWMDSLTLVSLGVVDSFYMVSPAATTTYGVYNSTDTVYTSVIVYNTSSSSNVYNECDGFSVAVNGNIYTTTGVYNDTIFGGNINGCDSIITTNLTVNPIPINSINTSICQGDSILLGGTYQTTAGTYNDTIINGSIFGCDSVIQTTLAIDNVPINTIMATICQGDSLLAAGAYQTIPGNYYDTIPNGGANGCDSLIRTVLILNTLPTNVVNVSICQGDSVFLGGSFQTTTGIYNDTIINGASNGCDSIIITTLTVTPLADATITPQSAVCSGDPSFGFTSAQSGGTWSGIGITDGVLGIFSPTVAGVGSHQIIYEITGNCGDADTINITVNASPIFSVVSIDDNCEQAEGSITLANISGIPPFIYNWDLGLTTSGNTANNLEVGSYSVTVMDSTGCSSTFTTTINDFGLDCDYHIYLPNVFSPNGDGENDVLFVRGKGIESVSLKIYNRWGNKVFESNNLEQGWDGTFKGKEQGSAVFVYYISATFVNGSTIEDKGNVSIVR